MPNSPELPTFFQHRSAVFNVLPDDKPMTWGLWDLDGCIGEIHLEGADWTSKERPGDEDLGPYNSWQDAIAGLLDNRADTYRP